LNDNRRLLSRQVATVMAPKQAGISVKATAWPKADDDLNSLGFKEITFRSGGGAGGSKGSCQQYAA
jgi:hypothetical protein